MKKAGHILWSWQKNANNANVGIEDVKSNAGLDMSDLFNIHAEVQDYGMVKEARLVTYTAVEIEIA